jgi:hypothetical protein
VTKIVQATAKTLLETARLQSRLISWIPPMSKKEKGEIGHVRTEEREVMDRRISHGLNGRSTMKPRPYNTSPDIEHLVHLQVERGE